jgi:hypothetical protein
MKYALVFLFCAGTLFAGGKKQPDMRRFAPADFDPYNLPHIGIAPFISPNNTPYLLQDTRALREKVTYYVETSGYFFVERNEYVSRLLMDNGFTAQTIYQQPLIMKLRSLPSNTLNYIVFGEMEDSDGGMYKVTLRLLDLDKAAFTVIRSGSFKRSGQELSYGIRELSERFINDIDTSGFVLRANAFPPKEYDVGDEGPAGGIIFFKKGTAKDGWRYLELSPVGAEFAAPWGFLSDGVYGPDGFITESGLGTGKMNTLTVIARMEALARTGSAAQIVRKLNTGGFDDWFIPSKDEMEILWQALGAKGRGQFSRVTYWTSSQSDNPYVWFFDFRDGRQYFNGSKTTVMRVRPIRAF